MTSIPDDFSRDQLKDRKWKGEGITMNHEIARIPTEKHRRCTDLLCCLIFVAFIVYMGVETVYGYVNGNIDKLLAPIDGNGQICGFTDTVKDYPYLYIDDISTASADPLKFFNYGVCVKSCPSSATDTIDCVTTTYVPYCAPNTDDGYETDEVFDYCVPKEDSLP